MIRVRRFTTERGALLKFEGISRVFVLDSRHLHKLKSMCKLPIYGVSQVHLSEIGSSQMSQMSIIDCHQSDNFYLK